MPLPLWPLLVFALLLAVKLLDIWRQISAQVESGYSPLAILGFVVFEDGCILGIVLLVLTLGTGRPRLAGALAATVLLVYAADVFLLHALFGRLTVLNVLEYAGELRFLRTLVTPAFALGAPAILLMAWAARRRRVVLATAGPTVAAGALLVAAPWLVAATRATDPYLELTLPNVVRLNLQLAVRRGVSDRTFERAKEEFPALWARMLDHTATSRIAGAPAPAAGERDAARPNLILLISESLSRVDSRRAGGAFDRLPRLDAVAARGATFTDLVSEGSNTTQALAALLAAEEPYPTPVVSGSMQRQFPVDPDARHRTLYDSLVAQAQARGYTTAFLSNAPLRFQGNGAWLERLGFGLVEGGEASRYEGDERYAFGAAPDEALFDRALDLLASERRRPLLLVLLTVSLHGPYRTPHASAGGSPLRSALGYVDRTTEAFYQGLARRGYLESGYLLVVGDHRRMTPLEPDERRDLGVDGLGLVFGCLVGPGVPAGAIVRTPLNQTDLFAVAIDLMAGSFDFEQGFARYNKGSRFRLGTLVTTHVLSGGRGLVRVRAAGRPAYTMRVAAARDPLAAAQGEVERKIAAYVVLRTGLLEQREEAQGP